MQAECLVYEQGIGMYIGFAEGQPLADEQIIEEYEHILAVECPVARQTWLFSEAIYS